jgi:hypothetical protein
VDLGVLVPVQVLVFGRELPLAFATTFDLTMGPRVIKRKAERSPPNTPPRETPHIEPAWTRTDAPKVGKDGMFFRIKVNYYSRKGARAIQKYMRLYDSREEAEADKRMYRYCIEQGITSWVTIAERRGTAKRGLPPHWNVFVRGFEAFCRKAGDAALAARNTGLNAAQAKQVKKLKSECGSTMAVKELYAWAILLAWTGMRLNPRTQR